MLRSQICNCFWRPLRGFLMWYNLSLVLFTSLRKRSPILIFAAKVVVCSTAEKNRCVLFVSSVIFTDNDNNDRLNANVNRTWLDESRHVDKIINKKCCHLFYESNQSAVLILTAGSFVSVWLNFVLIDQCVWKCRSLKLLLWARAQEDSATWSKIETAILWMLEF